MWEMQILLEHQSGITPIAAQWMTVMMPEEVGLRRVPYRYEDKRDAEDQLRRLYPDTSRECRRVVSSVK